MFGLFKKKEQNVRITEKITMSGQAKFKAMKAHWNANKNTAFIFWFDESIREAEQFFAADGSQTIPVFTAREANSHSLSGLNAAFGEHYPLLSKETALYEKLGLQSVTIFSSLSEPLFKQFGSDKIISLMKQLGMGEDEVVEHNMITKSIRNAQEKIEKKIMVEQSAHSQKEWMEKNLPAQSP